MERAGYHNRILRSVDFGDSLSLVVDAQENSSNSLPHFAQVDKSTEIGWKIQVRCTCWRSMKNSYFDYMKMHIFSLQTECRQDCSEQLFMVTLLQPICTLPIW